MNVAGFNAPPRVLLDADAAGGVDVTPIVTMREIAYFVLHNAIAHPMIALGGFITAVANVIHDWTGERM